MSEYFSLQFPVSKNMKNIWEIIRTVGYLSSINKIANVLTKLYTSGNVIRNV